MTNPEVKQAFSAKSSMSFGPAEVSFSGLPLKLVEQKRSKSRNKATIINL
jgi:hypothetical protein